MTSTEEIYLEALDEAREKVQAIQVLDLETISRREKLGSSLSFDDAVPVVGKHIDLYNRIATKNLNRLSISALQTIRDIANADYEKINSIYIFDSSKSQNPAVTRNKILSNLILRFSDSFVELMPYISFLATCEFDFDNLKQRIAEAVSQTEDLTRENVSQIQENAEKSAELMGYLKNMLAESGVSQQAVFFKDAADTHDKAARGLLLQVRILTGVLFVLSVLFIFVHKIDFMNPKNSVESAQFIVGKALVFGTVSGFLIFTTKNYFASKHNAIINRHRQNALSTYRAIVDAGGDAANKDIILNHAAECIFSDQPSGFSKYDSSDSSSIPLVGIATAPFGSK